MQSLCDESKIDETFFDDICLSVLRSPELKKVAFLMICVQCTTAQTVGIILFTFRKWEYFGHNSAIKFFF